MAQAPIAMGHGNVSALLYLKDGADIMEAIFFVLSVCMILKRGVKLMRIEKVNKRLEKDK